MLATASKEAQFKTPTQPAGRRVINQSAFKSTIGTSAKTAHFDCEFDSHNQQTSATAKKPSADGRF